MTNDERKIHKWFANHIVEYGPDDLTFACEDCAYDLVHDEWLDEEFHPVWEIGMEWFDKNFEE